MSVYHGGKKTIVLPGTGAVWPSVDMLYRYLSLDFGRPPLERTATFDEFLREIIPNDETGIGEVYLNWVRSLPHAPGQSPADDDGPFIVNLGGFEP